MSTLQENQTLNSKISDITNCFVKSEKADFISVRNFGTWGRSEENILEKLNSSLINPITDHSQLQPDGGDLSSTANHLSTGKEKPHEDTTCREKTFDEKLIIDIRSTVLQQEDTKDLNYNRSILAGFLNCKKNNAKKRFSAFLKSLCVLCDICDDPGTQRVIKLNRQERIVAAIILKKKTGRGVTTKKIFSTRIPEQSCARCFTKIILLHNRHKDKHTRTKIKEETGQLMDKSSHGYHCQCMTCQNQYGALPVLLKGIEEQNKMQSSQMQVNFQPEHILDISQSQTLINLQQPVNIVMDQNREQVNVPQYLVNNEEGYKSLQSEIQGHFHSTQVSEQSYSQYDMLENRMGINFQSTGKTATYLGQTEGDFSEQRINVGDQNQFDVNFQSQSQYYVPQTNVSSIQASVESNTSEQHLPTLLQELENKCPTELASQPSTSSGISSQFHTQDDKQSKKTMTCVHCDKNFTHKGDFNKHLRKHTKEKPYKCSFCDKMFSHTSNLHRHQRIHSGDRPFKCQYCDKCFNRKDKLESHKNSKVCKNRRNWK